MTSNGDILHNEGKSPNPIPESIEALTAFADDLAGFVDRCASRALFTKPPLRDDTATAQARLEEGRYLLRPCGGNFRPIETMETASELLDLIRVHLPDREDDVARLGSVFLEGRLDITDFLTQVYCNQGNAIRAMIQAHELNEDITTFFAVYFARPWRARAAKLLTEGVDISKWNCGYCPVCGHWPSLAHLSSEDGRRTLWCLHCTSMWMFPRVRCAFCLNKDHENLDILQPEGDDTHRVQACRACRRYIKEFRSEIQPDCARYDAVYLGTLALDIAAEQEGYISESNLTVRYDDPDGNELLLYRQHTRPDHCKKE